MAGTAARHIGSLSAALTVCAAVLGTPLAAVRADDWELTRPPSQPRAPGKPRAPGSSAPRTTPGARDDRGDAQRERYLKLLLGTPNDALAFERLLSLFR